MKRIYLDYAATTPVDPKVFATMKPYFSEKFGNASSLHYFGQEAKDALEASRDTVARCMGAKSEEVFFTSGGTESNNTVLKGVASANGYKGHIIISAIEHDCVLNTAKWLEKRGMAVTYLAPDRQGMVSAESVTRALRKDTLLVSVMAANNEIGTINPINAIGRECHERGVLFHTDAVQAFAKIPLELADVDFLTASSHKIYGPKGVGLLYKRGGIQLEPLLHGGGHERGLRSTTENVAGIVGFAEAVRLAEGYMAKEAARQTRLRDYLIERVLEIDHSWLNGHPTQRLPNNTNFGFDYIEGEALVLLLDMSGVAASTGSACSSKSLEPSHVLTGIGLSPEKAHGSLRMTLGRQTTKADLDYTLKALPPVVAKLRAMSPLGEGKTFVCDPVDHGHAD